MSESTTAAENTAQQEPPSITAAEQSSSAGGEQPSKQPPSSAAAANETKNANANNAAASSSAPNIEFEPPAACIRRLLKQALPKSTNVSKDSLSAISRASGIFVLYLTACANDVAREGRRTTIVAKDVLGALKELDFEEFVPLMEKFLEGHRKEEKNKKEEKERLKKQQLEKQLERELAGEEKLEGRDATTGKFVAKGGKRGDETNGEGGDEADRTDMEGALAVETKHSREEEGENNQPLAKRLKLDEEIEDTAE